MKLVDLIRKRKHRRAQRNRQSRKWQKTGKKGHGKAAKRHARAAQYLTKLIKRERKAHAGPRIITAAEQGIFPDAIWGGLGQENNVTGHYTAGPKDKDLKHCIELNQSYDDYHRGLGWGGIGYHFNISALGVICCLRPIAQKGTHVGDFNTSNVGIMMHGTTGDKPTKKQQESYKWLLQNAHTKKMPAAHRTSQPISDAVRRGHNDWLGHGSNSCPGSFKPMYKRGGPK